jgi:hypothetical protein
MDPPRRKRDCKEDNTNGRLTTLNPDTIIVPQTLVYETTDLNWQYSRAFPPIAAPPGKQQRPS